MTNRRRNTNNNFNNQFSKTLRDYFVPIIWLFLIILLIFSFFSWWWDSELENTIKNENQVPLNLSLDNDLTEAYIVYPGENKVKMESDKDLYKWERVLVKEWSISVNFLSVGSFKLSKLWELSYLENWELAINSWDLFVNSSSNLTINMKFWKVLIWQNSAVSISQNEMSSSVYLLDWTAEVRNLAWKSSVLAKWQKISISRLESNDKDLNLSLNKEEIDEFFKASDWFIVNNWAFYLSKKEENDEKTSTWTTNTTNLTNSNNPNLLNFDNLQDETYVSSSSINISWTYTNENITSIKLNNIEASINKETKTFNFKDISVSQKENNLVFKIYDDTNTLLQKFVYVVYYKAGESTSSQTGFQVTNYNVDWSDFKFSEPSSSNSFTTTSSFVTIRWLVTAKGISKVSVNDFELSSFNWSTWRYHADVKFNNLKEGTNVYNIKYFDAKWNMVYKNDYTIIKKPITSSSNSNDTQEKETNTLSWEVEISQ